VQPGEDACIVWDVQVHDMEPFEAPLAIFVEDNGIRELRLMLHGTTSAKAGKSDSTTETAP
jgi:hypothetical protein